MNVTLNVNTGEKETILGLNAQKMLRSLTMNLSIQPSLQSLKSRHYTSIINGFSK